MKFRQIGILSWLVLAILACSLVPVAPSWGQKGAPAANPQAPTITVLSPGGAQRGKSLEITLTGTNLAGPTGVVLGCPAKVTIPTDAKNGTENTKVKVGIDLPADTPVGWYSFRYATLKGVSNLRVFCVDDLPQEVSNGANRKATPQALPVPSVVSGSVVAEMGDVYKITVKAGQRLSFDCLARRLGSSMDAVLYVYDAKGTRELAYDNDSPGCQSDPRITYTFKEAGDYLVEVKDVLNRGGADYFYRLRVGDFPLATTPIPMAAKRGSKAKLTFAGPAVDGATAEVAVPNDPTAEVVWVAPKGASGLHGWPVPLVLSDHDEAVEIEPNNDAKTATRISVPGGVTGRFQKSGNTDFYLFAGKKGNKLTIEAHTLAYYSPSLVYMIVRNAKTGADVAKTNPAAAGGADQRIELTPTDDLDYILEVQHLYFASGPNESYRVTIRPPTNGFELNIASDRFDLSPGGAAAVPVQVVRKGYTGPIELSVVGGAGFSGTTTIKAGKTTAIFLILSKADQAMGPYKLSVQGKATVDGKMITEIASTSKAVQQALAGLAFPPMHLQSEVAIAVKERPPFSLAIKIDPPEGVPGGKAKVTVTVTRDPGFADEITLNPPSGLPPTVPVPKIGAIAKGKNEITFPLDLPVKAPLGEYIVMLTAKTKFQGKDLGAAAPPLMLVVGLPFDLKVETPTVALKPGQKAKLKVTATRKGGYKGPIAIDVRKLPPNVTAGKAIIAENQTDAEIEISADAKAAPIAKMDVDVSGTATALNNLANASPVFTVRIEKK